MSRAKHILESVEMLDVGTAEKIRVSVNARSIDRALTEVRLDHGYDRLRCLLERPCTDKSTMYIWESYKMTHDGFMECEGLDPNYWACFFINKDNAGIWEVKAQVGSDGYDYESIIRHRLGI
jgi:hypothetical protein